MPSATMPVAGEVPAEAAIVFNGNIDGDIATLAKTSHLLQPLSDQMKDLALIDRIHFYLPGWEMDKMRPEYLTTHYGLVVDYATEVWRELRKTSYADVIDRYFSLGSHLNQRDVRAVRKTVSGLVKLLHPNGVFDKEELQEYLELAMEGRRRVKEQLRRMGGLEFWAVNFSHIDLESRQETFIAVPEQGSGGLITPGVLDPGVTFSVGSDQADGRLAIFRAEVQTVKGNGKLHITGAPSRAARDGIQTAHTYLKTNASRLGLGKNPSDYDLHTQLVNLMGVKEGSELSSIPTPSTPRFGRWGWIER
jgi:ATP-dependent Lon protease